MPRELSQSQKKRAVWLMIRDDIAFRLEKTKGFDTQRAKNTADNQMRHNYRIRRVLNRAFGEQPKAEAVDPHTSSPMGKSGRRGTATIAPIKAGGSADSSR